MAFKFNDVAGTQLSLAYEATPVLTYRYGRDLYPPYLHPIHAPNGLTVTEDSPEGHLHRRGLCFGWDDINGVNFSAETNDDNRTRGRIVHRQFREKSTLQDQAQFIVINDWAAPDGSIPIVEQCEVTAYKPQAEVHVIDLRFDLQAQDTDVTMGTLPAKHGICYRAADMEHRKVTNSNSRIGENEVNGQSAKWCSLNGILGEQTVGVAIFDHPANERHPTRFFVQDEVSGFISTSFAHEQPYTISAGEALALKYRVLVYLGDVFTFDLWGCYDEYGDKKNKTT